MEREEYQNREVIFAQNAYQNWMYSICEGKVEIYFGYGTADEKKLASLFAGQYFGEIGMIGLMPRTATAVAASNSVVLERITDRDFEDYLKAHPENLQPIMSNVSRRIRMLTEDLSEITRITNEALLGRDTPGFKGKWLAERVRKLLDMVKAKGASEDEYSMRHRIAQATLGETPPIFLYRAGDVIFRAGDDADCMYEIYDGSVGIYTNYKTKNEKLLTELHVGAVLGEMGILDDMPRSADAVCLTDCCVLMVRREHFAQFFQKKPMKAVQILQQMCGRLRDLTKTYLQVCKTLEELPPPEQGEFEDDLAWTKLEYLCETDLYSSMYDVSSCTDWLCDCV